MEATVRSYNRVRRDWRVHLFFVLCGSFILGCAAFDGTPTAGPTAPSFYANLTISRTKGMVNKHFSTRCKLSSNYIDSVEYMIKSDLPPGVSFDTTNGTFGGVPTLAGFWTIKIWYRDRIKGTSDHPNLGDDYWYTETFELAMYDKLID